MSHLTMLLILFMRYNMNLLQFIKRIDNKYPLLDIFTDGIIQKNNEYLTDFNPYLDNYTESYLVDILDTIKSL